jgi:MFS family permease
MTGTVLMFATAPIIGTVLAPDKSFATLPLAVHIAATLIMVMPAAFIMKHVGRRAGFMIGAVLGICGSSLAAYALWIGQFWLFCTGLFLMGLFSGFGTYYRFAAADAAGPEHRGVAISYVLSGGVVAALLGPNLASWTANVIPGAQFIGSYSSLVLVYAVSLIALTGIAIPRPSAEERRASGRPLLEITRQPAFVVAVLTGMLSFAVMNLVMTSTPLVMHDHHYSFANTAFVVQWHMLGMFVPSFFTPVLIARRGLPMTLLWGVALCAACVVLNLVSVELWALSVALALLGVGWNFLAIGASTLLTQAYAPEESAKTQAINDFLTLAVVTTTSFASAPLHERFGWSTVNLGVVPVIALIAVAVVWLQSVRYPAGSDAKVQKRGPAALFRSRAFA